MNYFVTPFLEDAIGCVSIPAWVKKINRRQDERRVFAAPAALTPRFAKGGLQQAPQLLRHVAKRLGEVAVLELDDVNVEQQHVFRIARKQGADLRGPVGETATSILYAWWPFLSDR